LGYEFQNFEEALSSALGVADGDRRDSPRFLTVYRVARVFTGSDVGLVRVVNISNHGLMIATKLELSLGAEVTVDLSENCSLTGEIVWARPGQCGIKLKAPIDCKALIARLRQDLRTPGHRPLRLALEKQVVCSSELGMQIVRLRDISQKGAKVVHDGRFRAGLVVKLHLTPQIECRGVVRWSQDGLAGLQFEIDLSVPDLGSIRHL
jgi:PilZ domain